MTTSPSTGTIRAGAGALGSGALVALSLPPWGWWPLSFVGIATFATTLRRLVGPRARDRFLAGWLFAVGWLAPGMGWMWFLTPPGYVIAVAAFASLHGLASAAVSPGGRWEAVARPAAHLLAEAIRFVVPFGGVPLATLAIAQATGPFLGVVRLGGALALTWVTLSVGFALGTEVTSRRRLAGRNRRDLIPAPLWSLGVVIALMAVALVAPRGSGTGNLVTIAAVQGGGPQGTLAIETDPREVFERHLDATRSIRPDPRLDLVVWPENVISVRGPDVTATAEFAEVVAEAVRLEVPLVVGVTERPEPDHFVNAQIVVMPDGTVTDRYEKVRRVPFGEYVPLRSLLETLGAPVGRVPRDAKAGTGPAMLDTPSGTMAVVISWEVFFGGRAREGTSGVDGRSGGILLNPTNGASYTGTILQTQQVSASRLRAVETGRSVVQVSPTGLSAVIGPGGNLVERTGVSETRVLIHDIAMRSGRTWYSYLGDIPVVVLAAVVLALSGGFIPRRRSP